MKGVEKHDIIDGIDMDGVVSVLEFFLLTSPIA